MAALSCGVCKQVGHKSHIRASIYSGLAWINQAGKGLSHNQVIDTGSRDGLPDGVRPAVQMGAPSRTQQTRTSIEVYLHA